MNKKTAKRAAAFFWLIFTGLVSPLWLGLIYMDLTGHGKGYAYDLGAEADISVVFGLVLLLIWLAAVLPAMINLCKSCRDEKRALTPLPLAVFFLSCLLGISLLGWDEFLKLFGLGYPPL